MSMAEKEAPESGTRRMSVRFEGRVQGVGFRYTAVEVATRFEVTGYVCNQPDGSVTLIAEGAERDLVAFLHDLKSTHLGRYITDARCGWSPATGEFTGFSVRHAW